LCIKEKDGYTLLLDYGLKCCVRFTASHITCVQHSRGRDLLADDANMFVTEKNEEAIRCLIERVMEKLQL
jgi:hypothetical protein